MRERFTQEDVDRINAARGTLLPAHLPPQKRHKFGAKAVDVDGRRFDSKKEARRYTELKLTQAAGLISELAVQPTFVLMVPRMTGAASNVNEGKVIGLAIVAEYRADFSYHQDGVLIVEDVKSAGTRTAVYQLKRKMFEAQYGITLRET